MKKLFVVLLVFVMFCMACSKEDKSNQSNYNVIDKNVDSITLQQNLLTYLEYSGKITDNNKKLEMTFSFKDGVTVPENPPTVEIKVYLYMNEQYVGLDTHYLYNSYEDYTKPVTLTFDADGKEFNRYEIGYNSDLINESYE